MLVGHEDLRDAGPQPDGQRRVRARRGPQLPAHEAVHDVHGRRALGDAHVGERRHDVAEEPLQPLRLAGGPARGPRHGRAAAERGGRTGQGPPARTAAAAAAADEDVGASDADDDDEEGAEAEADRSDEPDEEPRRARSSPP